MKYCQIPSIRRGVGLTVLSVLTLSLSGCDQESKQDISRRSYQLVWSDDFDGPQGQLPDAAKWGFDIGNNNGWGNQELQNYTNSTENVALDGEGNLLITARKVGNSFTSARVKTQNLFTQKYGRFEARLKTPHGPGIWPAFWMLGASVNEIGWPLCGEIDIMELKGQQPNIIHGTVHGPGYNAGNAISASYALQNNRFDLDYHIFAVEWTEDQIDFFVDDYLYNRISKSDVPGEWVFNQDFFLILNIAVGGNYVGYPVEQTPFPQTMTVDYVKVYQ